MNKSGRSFGLFLVAVLSVALLLAQSWRTSTVEAQKPAERARWEYKVIEGVELMGMAPAKGENESDEAAERALNKLGGEGWELTGILDRGSLRWFVLKRIRR